MTADSHDTTTIIDLDPAQVTEERDDVASATQSPLPAPRRRFGYSKWALPAAALLLAAFGGGWLYRDVLSNYFPSERVAALMDRSAVLEKSNTSLQEQVIALERLTQQLGGDLDALETKSTKVGSVAATVQDALVATDARVAGLETGLLETRQQVSDLAKTAVTPSITPGAGDGAAVAALVQRMIALEKDVESLKAQKGQPADLTVLSQSLADLKAKIAAGTGFAPELQRVQRIVPAAAGLDVLARYGDSGLPDAKGLAAELTALVGELPKPIVLETAPADDSYFSQAWNMVSDLIKVRNTGEADWPAAAAVAAGLAEAGELSQAIDGLSSMEGDKPPGIQHWLDRAAGRVALEGAVQSVEDGVLKTLASLKAN